MLLNLDERLLRSSLRLWQEELKLAQVTVARGHSGDQTEWLARVEHTLTGCLAVLHASTPADGHRDDTLTALMADLREAREWAHEGRGALEMMAQVQR